MRISHSRKFVYLSIPKTASEAVRAFLDPLNEAPVLKFPQITPERPFYSHIRPVEVRAALAAQGYDYDSYFSFATVRNPWARLASLYRMTRRNRDFRPAPPAFPDWLRGLDPTGAADSSRPEKWYAHGVMSMSRFLADETDQALVSRVYRIEDQLGDLERDVRQQLPEQAPALAPLGAINTAPNAYDWQTMYSPEDRDLVARLYADDIETFGYRVPDQS